MTEVEITHAQERLTELRDELDELIADQNRGVNILESYGLLDSSLSTKY